MKKVIVASSSNSRRQLVEASGLNWGFMANKFDENAYKIHKIKGLSIREIEGYTKFLAYRKALSLTDEIEEGVIVGCDTVIYSKGKIFEKPKDKMDAYRMYDELQDVPHFAISGVALIDVKSGRIKLFNAQTRLLFTEINAQQRERLFKEGNPLNNAGGYNLGEILEPSTVIIKGSRDNVIGLPIKKIMIHLCDFANN